MITYETFQDLDPKSVSFFKLELLISRLILLVEH